ncbi:rRNA methyltransferase, partial [Micromonospora aurantiaca]|nr:rRNA methyltransferase [Micromonospora aurantiaca]
MRLRDVNLRKSLEAEHGLFVAEGEKVIRRAIAAGHPVRSLLMARRWADPLADVLSGLDAPVYIVDDPVMESITGFQVHRG